MNKKDVLGSRPAAWIIQKMKSMPHGLSAGKAQNTALNRARASVYLIKHQQAKINSIFWILIAFSDNTSLFNVRDVKYFYFTDWLNMLTFNQQIIIFASLYSTIHSAYIVIILLFHIAHAHAPIRDSNRYTKIHLLHTQHFRLKRIDKSRLKR